MNIDQLIADLVVREGDFSNRDADRGGPTRWGITQANAAAHGYTGDMRLLPQATAAAIYKADYWANPAQRFDLVAVLAPTVAAKLFDIGVNCGQATAAMMLQRALNVLNGSALNRDGKIMAGGATLNALSAYLAKRPGSEDAAVLLELIACFQGERYAEIVERDPTQLANIYGWVRGRVDFELDVVVPANLAGAA